MATNLSELELHSSGKVREIYEDGDDLIMVASDRISAFDVVLAEPIPDKGRVLTQMSIFWFETTGQIVPNHLINEDVPEEVAGRAIRVRKLDMYPVECVVRGYLSGSGWKEYRAVAVGLRHRAAVRTAGVRPASRSRSSPRPRRPRSASTTRTSTSTAPARSSARGR